MNLIPKSTCPHCLLEHPERKVFAPGSSKAPEAGDLWLCTNCAGISEFNAQLQLRRMSIEKMRQLQAANPDELRQVAVASMLCQAAISQRRRNAIAIARLN